MSYMLVIGYNPNQYSTGSTEPSRWLTLDVQTSKRVNASSTIAQHPIQTGDTISDHMYRNATTETVSGYFGILSGDRKLYRKTSTGASDRFATYGFGGNGIDKLTDVEEIFEEIKNMGYLCKLITMNTDNAETYRFKVRDNMALISINWEENENTVRYDFDFKEAITINKNDKYNPDIYSLADLSLPNVNALVGVSLSKMIQSDVNFGNLVVNLLYAGGYLSEQLVEDLAYNRTNADMYIFLTKATAIGAIGLGVVGGIMTAAGLSSLIPGVGWVAAGVLLCLAVFFGIQSVNASSEAEKYKNKVITSMAQLQEIYDKVSYKFFQMKSNCTVYSFPKNEECNGMIKIGNNYYVIEAKKGNTRRSTEGAHNYSIYTFSVRKPNNEDIYVRNPNNLWTVDKTVSTVTEKATILTENFFMGESYYTESEVTVTHQVASYTTPPTNLGNLDFYKNGWFCDDSGEYQVFVVNLQADDDMCASERDKASALSDLTNYKIFVCKGDIKTEVDKVKNVIIDALAEIQ